MKFETAAVHAGEEKHHFGGAVSIPIFQSSNFLSAGEANYHNIKYIRLNNTPNHDVLHSKLATLEKCEAALVTSSGMAAISTTLLTILKPGDHLLAQQCLYGGTVSFIQKDLNDLGIAVSWIDLEHPDTWEKALRPNTKAVYLESIANPLTNVGEIDAIANFAKRKNLVSIIDNTIATPFYFQPVTVGIDLVVHSASKYLNGHSDIVAGVIAGSQKRIDEIKKKLDHFGGSLDPHACFLLNRGIKTLPLRMRQNQQNAMALAKFLESHSRIKKVNYPGLESHPNHRTANRLFSGFSGLLSFEMAGEVRDTDGFIQKLRIPLHAASLGGTETLVTRPATTSHLGLTPAERQRMGIVDTLVRVSCGIENTEDLLEDFEQALG